MNNISEERSDLIEPDDGQESSVSRQESGLTKRTDRTNLNVDLRTKRDLKHATRVLRFNTFSY